MNESELPAADTALLAEGRVLAKQIGEYVDKLSCMNGIGPGPDPVPALNQRFVSIGRTYLQLGFMALERSILRPNRF